MTDPISNPYRKALDGWDEDHWVKRFLNFNEKSCLWGRMSLFTSNLDNDVRNRIENELELTINEMYPTDMYPYPFLAYSIIVNFNDDPEITFKDVQAVLKKAAVRWDEQHA